MSEISNASQIDAELQTEEDADPLVALVDFLPTAMQNKVYVALRGELVSGERGADLESIVTALLDQPGALDFVLTGPSDNAPAAARFTNLVVDWYTRIEAGWGVTEGVDVTTDARYDAAFCR